VGYSHWYLCVLNIVDDHQGYTDRMVCALMDYLDVGNPLKTQVLLEYVFQFFCYLFSFYSPSVLSFLLIIA
jgi:hypothetical protein